MAESSLTVQQRRSLLLWEAAWIPVEMAGVGLGLWLGLGWDNWDAAGFALFGTCVLSGLVRYFHYTR